MTKEEIFKLKPNDVLLYSEPTGSVKYLITKVKRFFNFQDQLITRFDLEVISSSGLFAVNIKAGGVITDIGEYMINTEHVSLLKNNKNHPLTSIFK